MENFKRLLKEKDYSFKEQDGKITVNHKGHILLDELKELPKDTQFNNQGNISLPSLQNIPKDVKFNNNGGVSLNSLKELPKGFEFNNDGGIYLKLLKTLPEDVEFNNYGDVSLNSLKELPKVFEFNNYGYISLKSLKELPKDAQFNSWGYVSLDSLEGKEIEYQNRKYTYMEYDYIPMLISSTKKVGKHIISKGVKFKGGSISKQEPLYVAEYENMFAHGETIKKAISELDYKFRRLNFDQTELVEQIKNKGTINIEDYRLLTGACRYGVKGFIKDNNLEDIKEMKIEEVLELTKGQYGHNILSDLF